MIKILKSLSVNAEMNLRLEQELLDKVGQDFLLFYINSPSVIVGRNQSIEAEVDLEYCRRNGIVVIRRISGGGTVYHDSGNLNYCFITQRGARPLLDSNPHQPIIYALAQMGIKAEVGSRGELLVEGAKISGTACYVKGSRQLFHGTLLFDTDMERMKLALAGDPAVRGRKIASVPSPTQNLKPLIPSVNTPRQMLDRMADSLARYYNVSEAEVAIF